jgi:hypothetical protein
LKEAINFIVQKATSADWARDTEIFGWQQLLEEITGRLVMNTMKSGPWTAEAHKIWIDKWKEIPIETIVSKLAIMPQAIESVGGAVVSGGG